MVLTGVDLQAATNAVTAAIRLASNQGLRWAVFCGGGGFWCMWEPLQSVGTLGIWHFCIFYWKNWVLALPALCP